MTPRFNGDADVIGAGVATRPTLPVLFHLMDVSRQRKPQPVPAPPIVAEVLPEAGLAIAPAVEPAVTEPVTTEAFPSEPFKFEEPAPSVVGIPASIPQDAALPPVTVELSPLMPTSAEAASPSTVEKPEPVKETSRVSPPRRKPKIQPAEDWLTTHGKYVALGFVLALVATIYLARTNRRTASGPVATAPHAHPGDGGKVKSSAVLTAATKTPATAQGSIANAPPHGAVGETSPAKLIESAKSGSESRAELFSPSAPQLASNPSEASPAQTDEKLFPWAKKGETPKLEERLASRPAGLNTGSSSALPSEGVALATKPGAAAATVASAPPLVTASQGPSIPAASVSPAATGIAYPTTTDRMRVETAATAPVPPAAPGAPPPQPSYPVTNYRSQFSPPNAGGGTPGGWSPAASNGAPAPRY